MTPIAHFATVWERCTQLSVLQAYLSKNVSGVLNPEELLRAEWVARVSALDLYVHELVAQGMRSIFDGQRPQTNAYLRFHIPLEVVSRILAAKSLTDAGAAFDLEVREQLAILTFQQPEKIADAVRLFSQTELWNEVALKFGATPSTKTNEAKAIKRQLSLIITRRNQIAHEGDLQPNLLRQPWPISRTDLDFVASTIEKIIKAIDAVV